MTITESDRISGHRTIGQPPNADYAPLGAALGHQCDDSQISLFWLSREGRTALQGRAMEGRNQV